MRGAMLAAWDDVLPDVPDDEVRANIAIVAAAMAEDGGEVMGAGTACAQGASSSGLMVTRPAVGDQQLGSRRGGSVQRPHRGVRHPQQMAAAALHLGSHAVAGRRGVIQVSSKASCRGP